MPRSGHRSNVRVLGMTRLSPIFLRDLMAAFNAESWAGRPRLLALLSHPVGFKPDGRCEQYDKSRRGGRSYTRRCASTSISDGFPRGEQLAHGCAASFGGDGPA